MPFCQRTLRNVAATLAGLAFICIGLTSNAHAFQVQGLFQIGPAHIGVAFDDSVNVTQALQLSNYTLTGTPARTITSVVLQENQQTVYLITSTPMPQSTSYTVGVSGVTGRDGSPLTPGGPTSFTTVAVPVMGIDQVQANVTTLEGQQVSVIGQVFLTASSSGGTPSAYVQDATGRGINVFGNPSAPPLSPVDALGNVALVTGTVAVFFTTVEISPFTATLVTSGMPHIAPQVLTVQQASSTNWEGTYIQTTATLTAEPVASGTTNYGYAAADGGTPFTFRVRNTTGIDPNDFDTGNVVTGAGAGSQFQSTFQVQIGNAFDFRMGLGPGDITPPTLVSAAGDGGASAVTVTFSEPVGAGAATAANYSVYPSAAPGSPIAITNAAPSGARVTLSLASPLAAATAYTVRVSNVEDQAGNVITPNSMIAFSTGSAGSFEVTGVFRFGSRYVGVTFSDTVNATQVVQSGNYAFTPSLAIAAVTLQANNQTAILETSAPLSASTSYSVMVSGITSHTGIPLASSGPFNFQTGSQTVTDIATVHENIGTLNGQTVTMIGQVYIPVGSRGGTPSGYIQDGSGRGLNIFGGSTQAAVNTLGNVVRVTGTVELYFTTVELTGYTTTLLALAQPHLGARVLTVAQANSSQWEGTYIETAATITSIAPSGASNYGYEATAGGANITFRVGNGLSIDPASFASGDRVTGRGAGGAFQSTFQINVGNAVDFFKSSGEIPPGPAAVGTQLRAVGGGPFPPLTLIKNLAGAGELFEFEIAGPLGARAVCRIFDLQGRLVKVLFDGALTGTATQTLAWDARDEQFEFVPAGMYVCHLETSDLNGNRDEDRAPIVVAVRLQ